MSRFEEVYNRFQNFNKFNATDKDREFIRCLGIEMAKAIYLDCGPNLSQDIAYILCAYLQSVDNRDNKRLHDYNKGN